MGLRCIGILISLFLDYFFERHVGDAVVGHIGVLVVGISRVARLDCFLKIDIFAVRAVENLLPVAVVAVWRCLVAVCLFVLFPLLAHAVFKFPLHVAKGEAYAQNGAQHIIEEEY